MKLTMRLGPRSYDIILKRGALGHLNQLANLDRKVLIVTDSGVPAQYAQTVQAQCGQGIVHTVPQGEASKCLAVYQQLLEVMLQNGFTRSDLVIAVGGGVVGDLAGFVAATYMRGVDFINCPTTTLSQIDSSIGGKVAVDLGAAKNIVGAFWQPRLVLIDPDTLQTLPRRHFVNGLAESIKMSLTSDAGLFELFEQQNPEEIIETIIHRSLLIKKQVVEKDETEQGLRAILNLGHTLGHGIEAVKGIHGRRKQGLYHGECVALGMLPMIEDPKLAKRVRAVYRELGLPARSAYNKEKVWGYILHDKKMGQNHITVVKVPALGCWRLDRLELCQLQALLFGKEQP